MPRANSYDWYKRYPEKFIRGARGLGPDVIGAYAMILDLIYADEDSCPNDPRWLGGILGCSSRKARALVDKLLAVGKLKLRHDGRLINERARETLETRANESRNHREAGANGGRTKRQNVARSKKVNGLALADGTPKNRIEKNRQESSLPYGSESGSHSSESGNPTCAEPSAAAQDASPIIEIPTNKTGEVFPVFRSLIVEYERDYPKVDVEQQLRNMRAWAISNKDKRKTKKGMPRFINAWLAKEQDRGGNGMAPARAESAEKAESERRLWLREYAIDGRWISNSSGNGVWKDTHGVGPPPHDPRTLVTDEDLAHFPKAVAMRERLRKVVDGAEPPLL